MSDTLPEDQPPSHAGPLQRWLGEIDRILRGDATRLSDLRSGAVDLPLGGLSLACIGLACTYGFFMGWYALFNRLDEHWTERLGNGLLQTFSSMIKLPLLFLLTLLVTFPSLYVFNALVGSRLTLASMAKLLVAAMAVTTAVLASFGPIVAFFSVTTSSHAFVVLLNVLFCGVAGVLGLTFLLQTLHRLTLVTELEQRGSAFVLSSDDAPEAPQSQGDAKDDDVDRDADGDQDGSGGHAATIPDNQPPEPAATTDAKTDDDSDPSPDITGALDRPTEDAFGNNVKIVFKCWVVLFAVVGSQMSWVLRPFIGDPTAPWELFRERQANFVQAIWHLLLKLFQ